MSNSQILWTDSLCGLFSGQKQGLGLGLAASVTTMWLVQKAPLSDLINFCLQFSYDTLFMEEEDERCKLCSRSIRTGGESVRIINKEALQINEASMQRG